jgi:hypothetical protein
MILDWLIKFFTSLRLTIVCLAFAIVLVFLGTLAQVDEGLYLAQTQWFRSFWVVNAHLGWLYVPLFPGGYLIGGLLLINLIAAHFARFTLSWRKSGILLVHFGLILLLLGQLLTDMFSTESSMRLTVGETLNYSEDFRANELVVINTTDPRADQVVAIPEKLVARRGEIRNASLPFTLRIRDYWPNCDLVERPPSNAIVSGATQGAFAGDLVLPLAADDRSGQARAAALVEIVSDGGSLGKWLLPNGTDEPETFDVNGSRWTMALVFAPAMGGNFLLLSDPSRAKAEQPDPIGEKELKSGRDILPAKAPFKIRVDQFWPRCRLFQRPSAKAVVPDVTRGAFTGMVVEPLPPVKVTNARNVPAAVVEVISPNGLLGTWLLPTMYNVKQGFDWDGQHYEMAMRFTRHYKPFSLTLLNASNKKYRGTDVPKDFRSRVRVRRDDTGEVRETEIYMNAPLRYAGYTFFQYQMAADESTLRPGDKPSSTFEVVRNPSWLTPYISCVLVGVGLLVQFLMHLIGFISKWRPL